MSATNGPSDDDRLANLLVDFETQLAAGNPPSTHPDESLAHIDDTEQARLDKAKQCVLLLEEVWPHAKPLDEELPRAIGRFRIVRELGRGGFSIVYLAFDDRLGREVALKVQRPEALLSAPLRERFTREAKAAARLKHPHIATVHEVGETGLQVWIASEYVAGDSLASWLRANTIPVDARAAAAFLVRLAEAVEFAHREHVLHRDLKPSNVLLEPCDPAATSSRDLNAFRPKLIDFGLAKLDEVARHETRSGALIGTPPYMSPEQAAGDVRAISPLTDVYGLGVILYELLTGRPAFHGENDVQTLRRVIDEDPIAPRQVRPMPADLEAICLKCLAKQPERRYASAGALVADLERFLAGLPTLARPASAIQRLFKWSRRHPTAASLIAAAAAATLAFVAISSVYIANLRDANSSAEKSRLAAVASAKSARRNEQVANQYLYASRMRLAQQAIEQGDVTHGAELLDYYQPPGPLAELRGFEWHHLKRSLHNERFTLRGHQGQVYGVTFTPDGKQVVSGGEDGTVRFWDADTGQEVREIAAHASCVNVIAYAPDGKSFATASCDNTVKLWDAATDERLATLEGSSKPVLCLAYCPTNSRLLAAAGNEPDVKIWDTAAQQVLRNLRVGFGVESIAWSQDGQTLYFCAGASHNGGDVRPYVWPLAADHPQVANYQAYAVATAQDTVGWGGAFRVVQNDSSGHSHTYPMGGAVKAMAFTTAGDRMAAAGSDDLIRVWDMASQTCTQTLSGHLERVQNLAFSPTGERLASASFDGTVKLWDRQLRDRTVHTFESYVAHGDGAGPFAALSADCRWLAFMPDHGNICVQDLRTGSQCSLPVVRLPKSLHFVDDRAMLCGPRLAANSIETWDVDAWRSHAQDSPGLADVRSSVRFHDDLIVVRRGQTEWIDAASGQTWHALRDSPNAFWDSQLGIAPDGNTLVVRRDHVLVRHDARRPRQVEPLPKRQARGPLLAISNAGRLAVYEAGQHAVEVVELSSDRVVTTLRCPDSGGGPAAFAPDGGTLALGGAQVTLWNVANGQEVARLSAGGAGIFSLRFSADGRDLAVLRRGVEKPLVRSLHGYPIRTGMIAPTTLTVFHGAD